MDQAEWIKRIRSRGTDQEEQIKRIQSRGMNQEENVLGAIKVYKFEM